MTPSRPIGACGLRSGATKAGMILGAVMRSSERLVGATSLKSQAVEFAYAKLQVIKIRR
jgi:hypothetical protein